MGNFLQSISQFFAALLGSGNSMFGNLFSGGDTTTAPTVTPGGNAETSIANSLSGKIDTAIDAEGTKTIQATIKKKVGLSAEMKNEIAAALTDAYQHDGYKAELADGMAARSNHLFNDLEVKKKADGEALTEVSFRGSTSNPNEQYVNGKWVKEALPAHLEHSAAHGEAMEASDELKKHWAEVNAAFANGGMKDVALSKLAANPVNNISAGEVFKQDKHGLRINMPANSRLEVKPVGTDSVSVTIRPISDDPKNQYNFAPVTLPSVSKDVFEQNYALVQPSKKGRSEIYVKAGTFDEEQVIGVLAGGKDVAGKGARLAIATDKGVKMQEAVATLSTYNPKPRTNETSFKGATLPVGVDHSDPARDNREQYVNLQRRNGYYNRGVGGYGYGRGVGNITREQSGHGLSYHPQGTHPRGRGGHHP